MVTNYIEKRLQAISANTNSEILYSQWIFDKSLIPEALNTIANIFPHYSLHNASHSEAILASIIKILGTDFIDRLSCTDLWLLLEAAYCHDMGMIIPIREMEKAIESGDFIRYIQKIKTDPNHSLHCYAKDIEVVDDKKVCFTENDFKVRKMDIIKFLLADYFRGTHAERSGKYVTNPDHLLSINSPRAVIPRRLYHMLGKICFSHSWDFNRIISEIPQFEDGFDTDPAHPRFVACMLRLGDLLDIDNYRFNETQLKTLSSIPADSLQHREKHLSINHKYISNKYIDISAMCDTVDIGKMAQQWFEWIRQEITDQTLAWHNIIPENIDKILPKIKELTVEITGYLPNNIKPEFTLDTSKALELLQGGNFYQSPFDAIREAIQNAVDSTLIRIWHEKKNEYPDLNIPKLLEIAQSYPIHINVNHNEKTAGHFDLVIADKGTGISSTDLRYMATTGSSSKNEYRQKIIQEMPDWLKPSGTFGIGFQSLFLLTDNVNIKTKSIFSDEKLSVEFHNPLSVKGGDILLKAENNMIPLGTELEMTISRINQNLDELDFNFDPFADDEYEYILGQIIREIKNYADFSFIPIALNGEKIERIQFDYTSDDNAVEIKFNKSRFYFKNAEVCYWRHARFLDYSFNYHKKTASEILTISRNNIKNGVHDFLFEESYKYILEYATKKEFEIDKDIANYLYYYDYYYPNSTLLLKKIDDILVNQLISSKTKKYKLSDLLKMEKIIFVEYGKQPLELKANIAICYNHHPIDYNPIGFEEYNLLNILTKRAILDFKYITYTSDLALYNIKDCVIYEKVKEYDSNFGFNYIEQILNKIQLRINPARRFLIPYIKGFENIKLINNSKFNLPLHTPNDDLSEYEIECILFPFIYRENKWTDRRTEKFYQFVYDNRLDKNISMNEIKADYDRFVEECKKAEIKFETEK